MVGTMDITPITTNSVTLACSSGCDQYQPAPLMPHQVRARPEASTHSAEMPYSRSTRARRSTTLAFIHSLRHSAVSLARKVAIIRMDRMWA